MIQETCRGTKPALASTTGSQCKQISVKASTWFSVVCIFSHFSLWHVFLLQYWLYIRVVWKCLYCRNEIVAVDAVLPFTPPGWAGQSGYIINLGHNSVGWQFILGSAGKFFHWSWLGSFMCLQSAAASAGIGGQARSVLVSDGFTYISGSLFGGSISVLHLVSRSSSG